MDEYELHQAQKKQEYEALCNRCGACCGALDKDPCEHLKLAEDKKYSCDIYSHRFGLRSTVGGKKFLCIPIRRILFKSWSGSELCAYKKSLRTGFLP